VKSFVLIVLVLTAATCVRADELAVVFDPVQFGLSGNLTETIGLSFNWDTTTGTLSDFDLETQGPIQGFSNTPSFESADPLFLDFFNSSGVLFQQNYAIHGNFGSLLPRIQPVPGTYYTDVDLSCNGCPMGQSFDFPRLGTATVTDVPEPSVASLVLLSLGALLLMARLRSGPSRSH
jgi:hypothetical protein